MSIIMTLSKSDFIETFNRIREGQFSYEALCALYDYYDNEEEENVAFDLVAICCEWAEYASFKEAASDFNIAYDEDADEDDQEQEIREHFEYNTTVLIVGDNTILIQSF